MLEKYDTKAMFCLLGVNAEKYPELVRRIYNEGHLILNHGYSEKWALSMNNEDFLANLVDGENAISAALGFNLDLKLYRPHGGFYKSRHEKIWTQNNWILVPATIRAHDAAATSQKQDKIVKKVLKKAKKHGGGIILLHDARGAYYNRDTNLEKKPDGVYNRSWIPETVEKIIISLIQNGFVLVNPNILYQIENPEEL